MNHVDECVLLRVSSNLPTRMIRATWRLSQYKLHTLLHNGYASTVFSGRCMVSAMDVVIKQYELHRLSKRERYHLFREMSIHSQLMHENIVQFYTAFVVKTNAYIVMQKCNGLTLRQIMVRCVPLFTEKDAVECVIRPLVNALIYMHSIGIVHRDIKPENVVIGMNNSATCLKLLDFGLANDLTSFQANSSAGTMQYMAPELFFSNKVDKKSYTLATDVWALGVMVYEMLHGNRPFRHSIGNTQVTYASSISLAARDFMNHALNANHDRRPPIAWFSEHAWLA
jgi:serine/threonine protein kinase